MSLEDALPSSAAVTVHPDQGDWGDVVVIHDSDESMAAGPTPGDTWNAAQAWLDANSQSLDEAGFDYVLLCNSAVSLGPSTGETVRRLSEMIPVRPGGTIRSVRTSQNADSGSATKISCE
jgi:hypothetical protein